MSNPLSNSDPGQPPDATATSPTAAVSQPVSTLPEAITLRTLASFLFGSRDAILALAAHRNTVWLGLIFVVSAGFAREYDGADLLHEPWHLLLPLVASLGTSFVLFCLVWVVTWRYSGARVDGFWAGYRSFLGLYWMTAPLAWLYAVPVERFNTPGDATAANLWFLAIVSLWRVLLITRVLSVLFRVLPGGLFFVVMLFADTLALTLVSQVDIQIFAVMGGVRLTESESILAEAKCTVLFLGVLSWPIWMIGTIVLACTKLPPVTWSPGTDGTTRPISNQVWSLAIASVAMWGLVLPWTQPSQQLRATAEQHFRAGRYHDMLATMSAHPRDAFPPHWDPPPHMGASRQRPRIMQVVAAFTPQTADWVKQLFAEKLYAALGRHQGEYIDTLWTEADPAEIISLVEQQPGGDDVLRRNRSSIPSIDSHADQPADKSTQKINATLLRLIDIPAELAGEARDRNWTDAYTSTWHDYLSQLDELKGRGLDLTAHEARLKQVLDNPQFVPEHVLVRARKWLSKPDKAKPAAMHP